MFFDFMNNETDSLNPEGLDLLVLKNNSEKIALNKAYLSKVEESSCLIF